MPRKSKRGGARQGAPGKSYKNRLDLSAGPRKVPLPNNMPYGEKGKLNANQSNTPNLIPNVPTAPTAPTPGPTAGPPTQILPQPVAGPPPPALDAPTQRPDEPLTSGVDIGPGAGSAALGINSDPGIEDMRPWLPALEVISALPGTSMTTKNFVRKIRSSLPYQPPGGVV